MGAITVRFAVRIVVGIATVVTMVAAIVVAAPIICLIGLTKTRK